MKLSQAKAGNQYKVEDMGSLQVLSQRLALLGLNAGVFIELMSIYKHGALVKTPFGDVAIGSDLLDSIMVTST
ncbi:MAG: FeoA domain-containing protein [Marinicellaceae bacterium]